MNEHDNIANDGRTDATVGVDEVSTHTGVENANGGNVGGAGGIVDVEHDTGDGAGIEGDTVQHEPETTVTAGDPAPAPAHPGMMNLSQFRDPGEHSRKLAARNAANPPRLQHGLRSHLATSTAFTTLCNEACCIMGDPATCPDCGGATCAILPRLQNDYIEWITTACPWLQADGGDGIMVEMLAVQMTIRIYCMTLINRSGGLAGALCKKAALGARVFQHFKDCERRIFSLCGELGLSPLQRQRLGLNIAELMRRRSVDLSGYSLEELQKIRDNFEWDKKLEGG